MNVTRTPHEWSKDALFSKAQRYAEEMHENEHGDWKFGFWSALTLEMLIRAALSSISPSLVADGKDWNNLLYAVGQDPNAQKFTPKSADISDLLKRSESVFPDFTREMLNFCVTHINRRNSDLHSGALPFDGLGTSVWLPMYYTVCQILLREIGESIESLFSSELADEIHAHIKAKQDDGNVKLIV